jgi:hypothetical protein
VPVPVPSTLTKKFNKTGLSNPGLQPELFPAELLRQAASGFFILGTASVRQHWPVWAEFEKPLGYGQSLLLTGGTPLPGLLAASPAVP